MKAKPSVLLWEYWGMGLRIVEIATKHGMTRQHAGSLVASAIDSVRTTRRGLLARAIGVSDHFTKEEKEGA